MKKMPLRADAVMEAFTPFPMDCSIMFVMTIVGSSGSAAACQRSATVPTAMTAGSFRKKAMMCGAKIKHRSAIVLRNIVP